MTDRWARWLLHDRCAGDQQAFVHTMQFLAPVRDRVLDGARPLPQRGCLRHGPGPAHYDARRRRRGVTR